MIWRGGDGNMADIFLSYAHEDETSAKRIVDALAREGLDAWWDHEIPPGRSWDEVIGTRIDSARVAVVIWSSKSVGSNFVKEEAQLALDAGKLLPVKVDECDPPVGFRRMHAANLAGWRGDGAHPQFRALVGEIRRRLDAGASAPAAPRRPPPPTPAPTPSRGFNPAVLVAVAVAAVIVLFGISTLFRGSTSPAEPAATDTAIDSSGTTDPAAAPPGTDARTIELQYWRSCCDNSGATASDYRAYLSRYPSGEFASIARQRIASPAPAAPPPVYTSGAESSFAGVWRLAGDTGGGCWTWHRFNFSGSSLSWQGHGDDTSSWDSIYDGGYSVSGARLNLTTSGEARYFLLSGNQLVLYNNSGEVCRFNR